jgi:hypothetical protein
MSSPSLKPFNEKKWIFGVPLGLLIVLLAVIIPTASLTVYEFKIKDKEIDYGEKLQISIVFVGDGAVRIKNVEGDTVALFILKKGGEYTYEIDSEGLLFPGEYFVQLLDENGVEVANESFKVTSIYTIIVVTFGEEKKAQSYLYDILIIPTTLKVGNNSIDIFFSSNTYSRGGAEVYFEVPEGWRTERVGMPEVDFQNHLKVEIGVPQTAHGSYTLTLHIDTAFGKFNRSFAVSVEGVAVPTPTPTPTPLETPTPKPTPTPTPTPKPTPTPLETPTPKPTANQLTNVSQAGNVTETPIVTPEVSTPGFEVYLVLLALLMAIGIRMR